MTPEMLAARQRLFRDFEYYASHASYIRTKTQTVEPLKLNRAQRFLLEAVDRQLASRGFVRLIICKGRQLGSSTFVESWLYWWVSQRKAQRAVVVAHDGPTARTLFEMTRRLHDKCPEILQPHTKYSGKSELSFDLLDSSYRIATAGGDGIVRGDTITAAHLSEFAWWPASSAKNNFSGLMDAIPNTPGTAVFIESTSNSFNEFYAQCESARRGESLFEFVFLPWFWDDQYREPVSKGFERSPEEEKIVALYGLDDEQLTFRRVKIAEKGEALFRQEFPLNADESFLTSGRPVFHPDRVAEMLVEARSPIARKALEGDEWGDHPLGELKCFLPHDPAEQYTIGADVGYGVRKDFSVAQVLDSSRRQAAIWRSDRVESDYYGTILAKLARYYNDALIICERNGPGILTNRVITKDEEYPHVYRETQYDKITDTETVHIGFLTTEKSKPLVIGELRAVIRDKEIEIYDRDTLDELRSYIVTESGRTEADKGHHDDCVMSLALSSHINFGPWTPIENTSDFYESIE